MIGFEFSRIARRERYFLSKGPDFERTIQWIVRCGFVRNVLYPGKAFETMALHAWLMIQVLTTTSLSPPSSSQAWDLKGPCCCSRSGMVEFKRTLFLWQHLGYPNLRIESTRAHSSYCNNNNHCYFRQRNGCKTVSAESRNGGTSRRAIGGKMMIFLKYWYVTCRTLLIRGDFVFVRQVVFQKRNQADSHGGNAPSKWQV